MAGAVKITRVEPILFDAGLDRVWLFVRVETDQGLVGVGEGTTTEPFMAAGVLRRLAPTLVGRDPSRIQEIWQRTYTAWFNVRGGPLLLAALSGVEHALWDIRGKAAGMPVHELLGGKLRDRVPVYANHMFFGGLSDATAYGERAAEAVERGYRAVKIDPFGAVRGDIDLAELRRVCGMVRAVRDAIGPDRELAIDTHAKFSTAGIIRVARALEEFDPYFIEEPVPPENLDALRKVRAAISPRIATGERIYTKWGYQALLAAQAAEIVQVDVAHCGGILEARFIAAMAESHYVQLAPHSWYGPVSLAASLQLDATIPNLLVQETPVPHRMPPQQRDLLRSPLEVVDGQMTVPTGPGLGIELDEDVLAAHRVEG
jgi:galactonate dehydratase